MNAGRVGPFVLLDSPSAWPLFLQLARDFLQSFYQVTVGSLDLMANKDISQRVEVCSPWHAIPLFVQP